MITLYLQIFIYKLNLYESIGWTLIVSECWFYIENIEANC